MNAIADVDTANRWPWNVYHYIAPDGSFGVKISCWVLSWAEAVEWRDEVRDKEWVIQEIIQAVDRLAVELRTSKGQ
jgi:hypothetical protein